MENKIRVIIADDHVVLRQGLRLLLEQDSDLTVTGEASNGEEVLALLAQQPADVVLMDVNMPVMDGLDTTKEVCLLYPATNVIGLSMHTDMKHVQRMLDNGASGYLLKTIGREELSAAIKLVQSGARYISGELTMKIFEQARHSDTDKEGDAQALKGLSKRELEVLTLVAEGFTNGEIAEKLFTSKRTIETHRQNILEKTQAKNTAHLIKFAIENKLIGTQDQE